MYSVMEGVLNVLKPPGMTSHDVVHWVRRLTGLKKVGHAGTLDPGASGILIVLLGRATRAAQFLTTESKEYVAEAVFGVQTDTQDGWGKVLAYSEASHLTLESVQSVAARFRGVIRQVPPMVSAVHHQGRRLYELARAGEAVEVAPRTIEIDVLELLRGEWGTRNPRALFRVSCSKGTYIRTLVADIGAALGCGACLGFLLRTRVGGFRVAAADTLEELSALKAEGRLQDAVIPVKEALRHLSPVPVKSSAVNAVRSGSRLYPAGTTTNIGSYPMDMLVRLVDDDNELLAVARVESVEDGRVVLRPVWVYAT